MEGLPVELYMKIFYLLDHQSLAAAQQVCRRWKALSSENNLWSSLFKKRWGEDLATFYAPSDSKSWKDVYVVQDRCDRVGLGLKIIREGDDYYLVHQGKIQRHLGSRRHRKGETGQAFHSKEDTNSDKSVAGDETCSAKLQNILSRGNQNGEAFLEAKKPYFGLLDSILFFIGDLEVATTNAKRRHVL